MSTTRIDCSETDGTRGGCWLACGARGELNVGQLVREHLGTDCRTLDFTTYSGP